MPPARNCRHFRRNKEKHRAIKEKLLGVFGQVLQWSSDASDDKTLEEEGGVEVLGARFQAVRARQFQELGRAFTPNSLRLREDVLAALCATP